MKAKIIRGKGARGASDYALNEGKKAKSGKVATLIGGNMSGQNAKEFAKEFAISRRLRPDVKKPVYHFSLSCPEGERLTNEKWNRVAEKFLQKMNIDTDNHQYFVSRHNDTEYDHIHIIASRIGLDGSLFHGKNDVFCAIKTTSELEKEFNLMPTPTLDFEKKSGRQTKKASKKKPTAAEIQMSARTGTAPPRMVIQNVIDEIFENFQSLEADLHPENFFHFLEDAGIFIRPNIAKTGRMNGLAFDYDGITFKGSSLGKNYSWKSLIDRGLIYEQNRDSAFLIHKKSEYDKRKIDRITADNSGSRNENWDVGRTGKSDETNDCNSQTAFVGIKKNNDCLDKKPEAAIEKDAVVADNHHKPHHKHRNRNDHPALHFHQVNNIDPDVAGLDDNDLDDLEGPKL